MKFLKTYEGLTKPTSIDPQKGDYVFVTSNSYSLNKFFKDNIGIVKDYYKGNPNYWYRVIFKNIPDDLKHVFSGIEYNKIVGLKENEGEYLCELENLRFALPEDIEQYNIYIAANKYNL